MIIGKSLSPQLLVVVNKPADTVVVFSLIDPNLAQTIFPTRLIFGELDWNEWAILWEAFDQPWQNRQPDDDLVVDSTSLSPLFIEGRYGNP